ncbi:MAG TPA: hypothetical protein PK253_12790 [Spirochaetota bacterium]|nr:hypothetical protein [Spirochaetota bacterium]
MKPVYLIFTLLITAAPGFLSERIRLDDSLIVPGSGAENIILGDTESEVRKRKGQPEKTALFNEDHELFRDIFGISSPGGVYYRKIYHYSISGFMVFFYNDRVSAIAGLNTFRVTGDSVSLQNGVDNFVYHYGNRGLAVLKKGSHALYLYREQGIAVIDDSGNDSIDMYLLFPSAEAPSGER